MDPVGNVGSIGLYRVRGKNSCNPFACCECSSLRFCSFCNDRSLLFGIVFLGICEIILGLFGIGLGWVRLIRISDDTPAAKEDMLTRTERYEVQNIRIWFMGALGFLTFVAGILILLASFLRNRELSNTSIKLHIVISTGIWIYFGIMFSFWSMVVDHAREYQPADKGKELEKQQATPLKKDLAILFVSIVTMLSIGCSIDLYRVFTDDLQPSPSDRVRPVLAKSTVARPQSAAFNQIGSQGTAEVQGLTADTEAG